MVEVIVLKKLSHPGIIKMLEVLEQANYIGIVMELCPYGDLFQLMKTISKSIELLKKKKKIIVYYLAQIIEAVSYMHSKHVIHRDLKVRHLRYSHKISFWEMIWKWELSILEQRKFWEAICLLNKINNVLKKPEFRMELIHHENLL